jgi:hypothetical protein
MEAALELLAAAEAAADQDRGECQVLMFFCMYCTYLLMMISHRCTGVINSSQNMFGAPQWASREAGRQAK